MYCVGPIRTLPPHLQLKSDPLKDLKINSQHQRYLWLQDLQSSRRKSAIIMIKELSRPHILRSEENEAVHSHSCHRMPILLRCLFLMKTALMSPPLCAYMHIYVSNTSVKSKPGQHIGRKNATLLKISWLIDNFTNCKGNK